jgi:hypothetical protein
MADEIEKMKADHEIKIGRKVVPLVAAKLKKDVVLSEENIVVSKGVVGAVMNEFGQLLFVIAGEVEGIPSGTQLPVYPDEVELL